MQIKAACQRLAVLKGQWLLLLLWPALGILAIIGLQQFASAREAREQIAMQNDALHHAEVLSHSFARQLTGTLDKLDQLTAYIKHDWEASGGHVSLEALRRQGVFPAGRRDTFTIIGADGRVKSSIIVDAVDDDFSGHAYFQHHQHTDDNAVLISQVASDKSSGDASVHLTRRLNRPDGKFDGIIVATVHEDFFAPLTDNPAFGKHGFKALLDNDGKVRFAMIDTLMASPAQQQATRSDRCRVVNHPVRLDAACFVDGQPRYAAVTALSRYPFKAMIGLSEQDMLQPLRTHARASRDVIIASTMLITFFCAFAWLLSIKLHLKRENESHIRLAYRLATENGRDGFYLWQRVRNKLGTVIDFKIVDCNERGANMYDLSRSTMIGKTITDLYGATLYRDTVIASGIQMDLDGEGESEYAVPPMSTMRAKWLHVKYVRTVEGVAVTLSDISDKVSHQDELARRATHDDLTGLPNRYWINKSLPAMLHRATHNREKIAVLFVDLDDFKLVNDTLGHYAGDVLLREVADRLQSLMRPGDRVARLGGDEFTIVLDKIDDTDQAAHVAKRIVDAFNTPFFVNGKQASVGASIGIALFPQNGSDIDSLLQRADSAMYVAKMSRGGFSFVVDTDVAENVA